MKYEKPPLTLEQQADQLIERGMDADRGVLIERLRVVSYYRLSGYWYPFREPDPSNRGSKLDQFVQGTSLDTVWDRYVFDRHLRLLVMDAIERIEVATRTAIAYHHSHAHGPFGYAEEQTSLPGVDSRGRELLLYSIQKERDRSKEPFIKHFGRKYGDSHPHLPAWMAIEVMSFGGMLTMYRACPDAVQRAIADQFRVPNVIFDSWLGAIHVTRNICAHHGRLWNRVLGVKPKIPRANKFPDWHDPVSVTGDRVFGLLTVCKHCMDIAAPQSSWADSLRTLLETHPAIPTDKMGYPANWQDSPLWN
jgi:abortive infection bacteriophage resistance protein